MRSIQSRLGIGLAASLIAVFALQWLVVSVTVRHLSENGMAAHMQHDMDNLLAGLSFDASGRLHLAPGRIEQVYQNTFSGNYFRLVSGDQVIRSRSLWDEDLPAVTGTAGQSVMQRLAGPQAQPLLMRTRTFSLQGRAVSISVAQDLTPLENDIRNFRDRYALVSAVALMLLLVLQAFLVRQDLRPLRTTREELKRLEQGDISALGEDVPQELQPLVRELNQLLAAMHRRLTRSRQALGNLAHALKTPLTLLTHHAEHEKIRAVPDLQRDLTTQLEKINRLIERELKRARLSGAALPGQRFDFCVEVPPLVTTLASLYREKRLDIATRLPDKAVLSADREDMLELLGNLLDNACKWAKNNVRIEVECAPGNIAIRVHDDGPGCPEENLAWLAQRGTRLDESAPGHGLGLAIALDIAADYGGRIGFGRSEALGGFLVTVHLKNTAA
jgi:signal transduction histidine kinase